jgi:hypothetical protein
VATPGGPVMLQPQKRRPFGRLRINKAAALQRKSLRPATTGRRELQVLLKEFSGLDTTGSQLSDEGSVGGEEVVIA